MVSPRFISVKEIESLLRRLRGVAAARVVCDASGGIEEIHAVSEADRPAKMVVRDIESALLAHWNLPLDRKKISVAQLQARQAEALKLARPRLRLVSLDVAREGEAVTARVVLRQGDADSIGAAAGPEPQDTARLLATATLRAVEGGGDRDGRLRLLDITRPILAERAVVVVLVALRTGKEEDLLTGSALERADAGRAVVAATLDAVNRRLAALDAAGDAR